MALTTGNNAWAEGLDVVVEGTAVRVTGRDSSSAWPTPTRPSTAATGTSTSAMACSRMAEDVAGVFRIEPAKVLAFAKDPHGQTTYRF